jgi:septum formation protein
MKALGRIVLASASPRRKEFFDQIGIVVEVVPSDVAEVGYGGDPALLPLRITRQKLKAVRARLGSSFQGWVVAADTVVALDREIFGKPKNEEDAKAMLRRLSGKTHKVFTGYRVEEETGEFREETVATDVTFCQMSEADIKWYVDSGESSDKAGAYAIQGKGGVFVEKISGSYSNVVGLPLAELLQSLRELKAVE